MGVYLDCRPWRLSDLLNTTSHAQDGTSNRQRTSRSGHHLGVFPERAYTKHTFMVPQAHHEQSGPFALSLSKGEHLPFETFKTSPGVLTLLESVGESRI